MISNRRRWQVFCSQPVRMIQARPQSESAILRRSAPPIYRPSTSTQAMPVPRTTTSNRSSVATTVHGVVQPKIKSQSGIMAWHEVLAQAGPYIRNSQAFNKLREMFQEENTTYSIDEILEALGANLATSSTSRAPAVHSPVIMPPITPSLTTSFPRRDLPSLPSPSPSLPILSTTSTTSSATGAKYKWEWQQDRWEDEETGLIYIPRQDKLYDSNFKSVNNSDALSDVRQHHSQNQHVINLAKQKKIQSSRYKLPTSSTTSVDPVLAKFDVTVVSNDFGRKKYSFELKGQSGEIGQIAWWIDGSYFSFNLSKTGGKGQGVSNLGAYMIYYVLKHFATNINKIKIDADDDGSGKLINWYKSLGFEDNSAKGGGLIGSVHEIMSGCLGLMNK